MKRSVQAQPCRQRVHETLGVFAGVVRRLAFVGEQGRVVPGRLAVGTPADRQRPARQLLARVPLALAEVQESAPAIFIAQSVHQFDGVAALGRAHGVGVPLGRVPVAHRDKGRLAAHGQAHVARLQLAVHGFAQRQHIRPLRLGVGLGHARRLVDARDLHVMAELDFGVVDQALDRRRAGRLGRAGQRDVALAGEQARGRVQPDPPGARQVHLAPRVQVGEVDAGAAGTVQGLHVRRELDQVARDEAGGQAAAAQQLHQQPAAVAAGAAGVAQGLLGRLHARLHADQIADVVLQFLVDAHQEVDGALRLAIDLAEVVAQQRRVRLGGQVGRQFLRHQRVVLEREILGAGFEEEIERVVDRHFHHQVDRHLEPGGLLRENQPRLVIGEGVLLPVDEMLRRLDLERIGDDGAARMRGGPQTHHLGAQLHRPVVAVVGDVVQCGVDGHALDTSKAGASFEATRWPARSAGRMHEPLRMLHAQ